MVMEDWIGGGRVCSFELSKSQNYQLIQPNTNRADADETIRIR